MSSVASVLEEHRCRDFEGMTDPTDPIVLRKLCDRIAKKLEASRDARHPEAPLGEQRVDVERLKPELREDPFERSASALPCHFSSGT
jgi:hypothetical protein